MTKLSADDYNFVTNYLYKEAGISLGLDKEYLVENRLNELCRSVGLNSISALVTELKKGTPNSHRQRMVEAMTTNETSFFRDSSPYEALKNHVIPELIELRKNARQLRIWSAACSTGQEPYTLAMLIHQNFGRQLVNWRIEIVGTDLAEKVLEKARSGVYTQLEINRGVPPNYLSSCFSKHGQNWQVLDELRAMTRFQRINLLEVPANLQTFDLVLCRNVLIYFDQPTKLRVLKNLHRHIKKDGYLMVGASEVLHGIGEQFKRVQKGATCCHQPC